MLHDELKKLNSYPFHMPGHKRNKKFGITGAEIDITEISGYDDLHNPTGLIKETEIAFSKLYSSEDSLLLVNGSTVGILAAVFAMTHDGDKVIVAANCHKSVYNACELRKLNVIIAKPEFDCRNGIYGKITNEEISRLTKIHSDIKLIIITSPTYEGYTSNIETDIPILADSAHGAHLPFFKPAQYPRADVVITSLHKTLPALTQTALANVYNKKYTAAIKRYLDIFETSSPSYVLMNSASLCAEYLKNNQNEFISFRKALEDFYNDTQLNHLSFIKTDDLSKINISAANSNISGIELGEILRKKYGFECEAAQLRHVILMATIGDDFKIYKRLSTALKETDAKLSSESKKEIPKPIISDNILNFVIDDCETKKVIFKESAGKISAEFVYAYPPGIPILYPNEIIIEKKIEMILNLIESGVNITSNGKLLPRFILTKQK